MPLPWEEYAQESKPWEEYSQPKAEYKPWEEYAQPDTSKKQDTTFDKIKGVGEAALSTALGAVNWIPSGVVKAAGVVSGQTQEGSELGDYVQEKLSYQPKTETGKKLSGYVAAPFEYISEKSQDAADWTYDKTGSPLLSTAVRTAGEAIPFVAPVAAVKGVKAIKRGIVPENIGTGLPEKLGEGSSISPEVKLKETLKAESPKDIFDELKPETPVEKAPEIKVEAQEVKKQVATKDNLQTTMEKYLGDMAEDYPYDPKTNLPYKPSDVPKEWKDFPIIKKALENKKEIETAIDNARNTETAVEGKQPLIEGELKPHRTAQRIEAEAISKELFDREGFGEDIAKYQEEKGMMEAQAQMGVDIMDKDWNSAVKMALGEVEPPQGVRPGTMITSVAKRAFANGDVDTLYKLGTTEKSYTMAQEIAKDLKSFDQGLTDNPVAAMQAVRKARKEELTRTGQKVDAKAQSEQIKNLEAKLAEVQKRLDAAETSKPQKVKYGSKNKLVTNEEYLKVKQELSKQLGVQLNVGIDPTIIPKLTKIGAYHIEAGVRNFKAWSERIIQDVGEWVKPHLKDLWAKSNDHIKAERNSKRYETRVSNEAQKLEDKLINRDLSKQERSKTELTPNAKNLKDLRDRLNESLNAARRKTGEVTIEEAKTLVELSKKAADLKAKRDPNVTTNHGFASVKERLEYGMADVKYKKYVNDLIVGDESLSALAKRRANEFKTTFKENPSKAVKDLAIDTMGEIADSSIALVASMDNSFIGRQGLITLQTHPTVWAKAAAKSFTDIYQALTKKHGNELAKDILHADLVSRENYLNGTYKDSGILAKFEEQYPTSHPARIPYVGRLFKASEVAFTNTALRMRLGTFDLLLDMAKKEGKVIDKTLVKDIGDVVNSATARAATRDSKLVKNLLWAPKMIVANVNVLTGHGLGAGLKTAFARKQAAYNLMKIVGETAAVVAVLDALKPDSVETDPRSSDFLKYRDGNTRIDLTAGRGQYITLLARFFSGQTKNAQTKIIKELNSGAYGSATYLSVGLEFLKNKTSPMVRQGVNYFEGRNFEGRKPTLKSSLIDMVTPIPIKNVVDDSFGEYSDDRAIVLISNLADILGVNANTYQPLAQWDKEYSKELNKIRDRIGEDKLHQLNVKYNKIVNEKISRIVKMPEYLKLSDKDKETEIKKVRAKVKKQVLGI